LTTKAQRHPHMTSNARCNRLCILKSASVAEPTSTVLANFQPLKRHTGDVNIVRAAKLISQEDARRDELHPVQQMLSGPGPSVVTMVTMRIPNCDDVRITMDNQGGPGRTGNSQACISRRSHRVQACSARGLMALLLVVGRQGRQARHRGMYGQLEHSVKGWHMRIKDEVVGFMLQDWCMLLATMYYAHMKEQHQ